MKDVIIKTSMLIGKKSVKLGEKAYNIRTLIKLSNAYNIPIRSQMTKVVANILTSAEIVTSPPISPTPPKHYLLKKRGKAGTFMTVLYLYKDLSVHTQGVLASG